MRRQRQTYGYLPARTALLLLLDLYSFPFPQKVQGPDSLSGWLHTKTVYQRIVTHPSTNRARRLAITSSV